MTSDKNTLRKSLLLRRSSLPREVHEKADGYIAQYLLKFLRERATPIGATIGLYWPMPGEAGIDLACKPLLDYGLQLALPRVVEKNQPFSYRAWNGAAPTATDALGIPCSSGDAVTPDIVIMPMVGFNRQGHRLGMGGGYFDRSLPQWPNAVRVGVAYSCQEAELPQDEHDIPVHIVITEEGIIECRA